MGWPDPHTEKEKRGDMTTWTNAELIALSVGFWCSGWVCCWAYTMWKEKT